MLRPDLNRRRTDQRVMLHIAKGSRYSSFHWHGIIMLPNSFAMNCVVKEQMRCSGVAKRWHCKRGREGGCFTANSACNSTAFRWRSRGSMEGRKVAVGDWTVMAPSTRHTEGQLRANLLFFAQSAKLLAFVEVMSVSFWR